MDAFLDTHSMKIHMELNEEINHLEIEKRTQEVDSKDKSSVNQLMTIDSLERFAREKYGHKRRRNHLLY